MAKTKDGFYKQIGSTEGSNSYLLLAGGDYIGFSNSSGSNTVVQRDSNGFIVNSYFNTTSGGAERNASGLGYIAGFNTSDYYIRSYTSAAVKTWLGLGSNAYTSTAYLPLSGGTMTDALNFKNGTWNNVGDDVAIGDINVSGQLGIKALNTANPGIAFYNNSAVAVGNLVSNAGTLQWSGSTIWHAGNFNPNLYLPLAGGTMTGQLILDGLVSGNYNNGIRINKDSANWSSVMLGGPTGQTSGHNGTSNWFIAANPDSVFMINPINSSIGSGLDLYRNGEAKWRGNTIWHSGNLSSFMYEANLAWGGKNFTGTYGCIDAAMVPFLGANRLAFANPAGITVEYSRDSGGTWTDYGASDSTKRALTSGSSGANLMIGNADSTNKDNGTYQLRITINTGVCSIYTQLNKFCIYISTNGSSGVTCTIEKALESTPDIYSIVSDMVPISGWSGYNIINTPTITTYGNTPTSQYGRLRFIFRSTGGSTTYSGLKVINIFGFGGVGWTTPSNMARWGQIYSFDSSQNVTFPAIVTATSFNGTATAANKVNSTLTFTGYSTSTFNGSSNVSVAIPNNTNQLTNGAGFITSSSSITGNAATATKVIATVTGTNNTELVRGNMADGDYFRILVGGTASNSGYAEIATADDGTEPIYVRQYSGVFTSLVRTATLLDASGNTIFPGSVTASYFYGTSSSSDAVSVDEYGTGAVNYIMFSLGQGFRGMEYDRELTYDSDIHKLVVPNISVTNLTTSLATVSSSMTVGLSVSAAGFNKTGYSDLYMLLAGGGAKLLSDFRLQSEKVLKMVFRGYFTWTGTNSTPSSSNVVYSDFCTSYVISRVSTGRYRITFTGLKTTSSISADNTLQIFGAGRNINSDGTPCHVSILNVSSNYFDIITADDASPNDTSAFTLYINQML